MDNSNIWFFSPDYPLKRVMRIAAVLFLLASLPTAYFAWLRERDLTAVRQYWVEATAAVQRGIDDVSYRSGRRGGHYRHTYYLVLSWTDNAGREQTFTRTVTPDLYSRMALTPPEARKIAIRYLPGHPELLPAIPGEYTDRENFHLYLAAGLLALGLGAAWLGWPPRRTAAAAAA